MMLMLLYFNRHMMYDPVLQSSHDVALTILPFSMNIQPYTVITL